MALYCLCGGGIDEVRIGDVSRNEPESLLARLSLLLPRLGGGGIEFDRGGACIDSVRGGGGGNDSSSSCILYVSGSLRLGGGGT